MRIEERLLGANGCWVLHDASLDAGDAVRLEDDDYWVSAGRPLDETTGRGSVRIIEHGDDRWVRRHYHRGGAIARLIDDHYLWTGLQRTRSFREWRLLAHLAHLELPAPSPVAARVCRSGLGYRADLMTRYLPGTRPLSAVLNERGTVDREWPEIGRMVRAFHEHGIDHPDLTAHNILIDGDGRPYLVDFDNARIRPPGAWTEARIKRLQRSLRKVALETGATFDDDGWQRLERTYRRR